MGSGGSGWSGGAAEGLSSVSWALWGQDMRPDHGTRIWGQNSSLQAVICSKGLELHFIDELDAKQTRQGQVMEPNPCTKPAKGGPDPNVIIHLIAHVPRVKSSDFTPSSSCFPGMQGQGSWAGSSASLPLPCLSQQVHSARSFHLPNTPDSRKAMGLDVQ